MDIRQAYLELLAQDVEHNLSRFDESTGRFLTGGGWAVTNQDIVYPLALLYTQAPGNPHYHDERILAYALRGADAWRDFQYPDGRVEFVKVDGSTWGAIYMPWSMYHWLETYALLRDLLEPERRARWEEGLTLAYDGIGKELEQERVHNIPTWNGMAIYRAGQVLNRPDWQERGRKMIELAVAAQTPQGYWREHHGPTTLYNLVYTHAIGLYHCFSGDESVLPCLERAVRFHIRYTYPDGRVVETIDGRVKYHDRVSDLAHASFSLFPDGRRHARLLLENLLAQRRAQPQPRVSYVKTSGSLRIASAEYGLGPRLASAYVHYRPGEEGTIPEDDPDYVFHDEGHALIHRQHGWFTCLSGIVTPPVDTRWGQDRQNYVSVWNERTGLIIGGGNSKDQPAWSTFVVGGETDAIHVPDAAVLHRGGDADTVALSFAGHTCTVEIRITSAERIELCLTGTAEVPCTGGLTFKLAHDLLLHTGAGAEFTVGAERIELSDQTAGGWIAHRGWRVDMPPGSRFTWPVAPFNPYTADGAAPIDDAAAVLHVPLADKSAFVTLVLEEI